MILIRKPAVQGEKMDQLQQNRSAGNKVDSFINFYTCKHLVPRSKVEWPKKKDAGLSKELHYPFVFLLSVLVKIN